MKSPTRVHPTGSLPVVLLAALFAVPGALAETLVVANKAEATVSLIDLEQGEVVATLPTGEGPHEIGISPDGRFALVTNYGTRDRSGNSLTLIDIAAATVVSTIDLGDYRRPHGVEWLDDKQIGTDQEISHMVALDPARGRAYTANIGSGSITVLDLGKGARESNIATGDGAEGIAVSASGKHIWVTNRAADTITILDAGTLQRAGEISSEGFPIRATATPKGQVLVTRARAGDLAIYDAHTFEELRIVTFDLESMDVEERLFGDRFGNSSVPIGVIVDSAGDRAWVAHANADVITEIDLGSGDIVRTLRAGKEPDGMGFSNLEVKR
jgi:YVTN family beta-propeller protein